MLNASASILGATSSWCARLVGLDCWGAQELNSRLPLGGLRDAYDYIIGSNRRRVPTSRFDGLVETSNGRCKNYRFLISIQP